MEDEVLIEKVRAFPHLYDPQDAGHFDQKKLKTSWEAIGNALGATGAECKKRWTNLRDQYRRNVINKRKTTSGQAALKRTPWRFQKILSFLDPCMGTRLQKSNLPQLELESEDTRDVDEPLQSSDDDGETQFSGSHSPSSPTPPQNNVSSGPSNTNTPENPASPIVSGSGNVKTSSLPENIKPPPLRRKSSSSTSSGPSETAQVLKSYLDSKKPKTEQKSDHIKKFMESVEETIRTLPPIMQVEAKAKINSVVSELEMKSLMQKEAIVNVDVSSPTIVLSPTHERQGTDQYSAVLISPIKPVDFSTPSGRFNNNNFQQNLNQASSSFDSVAEQSQSILQFARL